VLGGEDFPCRYLGTPLSVHRLKRSDEYIGPGGQGGGTYPCLEGKYVECRGTHNAGQGEDVRHSHPHFDGAGAIALGYCSN